MTSSAIWCEAWRSSVTDAINPADGVRIFFDDSGGTGEPVLLLHGSALSRAVWRGLGYTAAEVLKNISVTHLLVIDLFQAVIDWHREGLVPNSNVLTSDARCELRQGDFFQLARTGFDAGDAARKFDAVLLDIDHSPEHFLDETNESFYTREGFAAIKNQLKPGGVFALWSDDPASEAFTAHLKAAFGSATAHNIEFPNPYTGATSVNSVYVARR